MSNIIQIDDGSEVYDIVNKRGEKLGQFKFIPSDFDLVKRYEETVKAIGSMMAELETKEDTDIEFVKQMDERIGKQVDYLFGAPVAESFFSITSPFTILDSGQFFIENVINAIRGIIEAKRNVKLEAVKSQVEKYTAKYKAGPGGHLTPVR